MEHTNSPTRRGHLSKSLPLSVRFASGGGFRRRVPATPQTENKASSLGEHPRKFGNAFSCTGSFVNSPKISISSSPNGCRNAKARSIHPLQPKRPVWTGTTRGTGGHHHTSCFWRRTHREKKTTPCAHRAAAYHPALRMSATTTVTRQLELTSKFYPPLHWLHATTTHRCSSCFKGPER